MTGANPQRVVLALLAAALPAATPAPAQTAAGAQLWRLAAATLPTPSALTIGAAATFWNPAQPLAARGAVMGLDLIQTPAALGITGFVAALHVFVAPLGSLGFTYGRMDMTDLARTSSSPDPVGGPIPYHAGVVGVSWTRTWHETTLGAALRRIETRLDLDHERRWTVDGGVRHQTGRLRLAAATHFLSTTRSTAAQDVSGGVAFELWEGEAWVGSRTSTIDLRYGVSLAHGFAADHQLGLGIALGDTFGADALVAREGGYAGHAWRPVGGVYLNVGRYRVTLAGNAGVRGIGSAFRVGLETRL